MNWLITVKSVIVNDSSFVATVFQMFPLLLLLRRVPVFSREQVHPTGAGV